MGSARNFFLLAVVAVLAGCGGMMEDLNPSSNNNRPVVTPGSTGYLPGQLAPDFTVPDMFGNDVTLSTALTTTGVQGAVLYFTMWCPICWDHMDNIQNVQMPAFPNVRFFVVDYVNGTIADVRQSAISNGYGSTAMTVLADTQNIIETGYYGTMGITVVVDRTGVVRMNEDFRDGARLHAILAGLP